MDCVAPPALQDEPPELIVDAMICRTEKGKPREIGGRYVGLVVDGVDYPDQPSVVLREAIFEEWVAGRPREEWEQELPCDPSEALFYEVSID